MRKFLISLLLASAVASPAFAGPRDSSDREQAREDRQQAHEERVQVREERQQSRDDSRGDRSANRPSFTERQFQPQVQQERQFQPQVQQQRQAFDGGQFSRPDRAQRQVDVEAMRAERDARRDSFAAQRNERIEQVQQRFEQRQQDMRDARDFRQSTRPTPNVMRSPHPLVVSDTPRPGTQPPLREDMRRTSPQVQWNTSWRNDHHYDWHDYRRHHRSIFHLGFYYDPFGWGYSPYQIGWRLWPAYYSNRYWINDPWMYRLPYAPPGYVWVRYWNDALLVDTWTGEVVDEIPDFFW
jgi:Nickel/cobalt transporter regulator